ncbi:hypothetical protein ACFL0V_07570 [Nanoarchaeota archaeon]
MARLKKRLLKSKKAQAVESQFNWIFIMIVGAVILGFFVFIVIKQKAASDAKFSGKVTKQLNTILVGAKVSSGTYQEIPTPEVDIRWECNDYYIGPASQRLGNRVVFAPTFTEGNKLITWTLDWNVPFKITSFLYITTPTIRYFVIAPSLEDKKAIEFYNKLPPKLNKQMRTIQEFNEGGILFENDKHARFIFFNVGAIGTSFPLPPTFLNAQTSGLNIDTEQRQAQFLQAQGNQLTTSGPAISFYEDPVLFGAVFNDDPETYSCLMQRAYIRLNLIASVYLEKLNTLAPEFESTSCEGYYLNNAALKNMIQATDTYPPSYGGVGDGVSSLKTANTKLQLQSCPLIY